MTQGSERDAYILGTHDAEMERLGFQHRVWAALAFGLWERAGFRRGSRLLDVGCGPGYASLDLARLVGREGSVVSVDASERYLGHLRRTIRSEGIPNIDTLQQDVQALALEPESFDGAYARWVLCFVHDPKAVVAHVASALRPGGVFAVQDYFNQRAETVAPRHPAIDRVMLAMGRSWETRGGDPDIGGRLPGILAECGLELVEMRPHIRTGRPGSLVWRWIEEAIVPYVPTMVELDVLSSREAQEFAAAWKARSADPNAFFCSPPVLDFVARKPG